MVEIGQRSANNMDIHFASGITPRRVVVENTPERLKILLNILHLELNRLDLQGPVIILIGSEPPRSNPAKIA